MRLSKLYCSNDANDNIIALFYRGCDIQCRQLVTRAFGISVLNYIYTDKFTLSCYIDTLLFSIQVYQPKN